MRAARPTVLVGVDILPRQAILLVYLVLEVFLAFLEHLQLRPEGEDCILGSILLLRSGTAKEPAPPRCRHGDDSRKGVGFEGVVDVESAGELRRARVWCEGWLRF